MVKLWRERGTRERGSESEGGARGVEARVDRGERKREKRGGEGAKRRRGELSYRGRGVPELHTLGVQGGVCRPAFYYGDCECWCMIHPLNCGGVLYT